MTKRWMEKPLPPIPREISDAMRRNRITPTSFDEKNDILASRSLQEEAGYRKMSDGSYLVSMYCPMPDITPDMIEWWFWWHPQKNERYQMWFPGSHFSNGYSKKQASYFECEERPEFQDNTQYPNEKIGGTRMPLRIDFVTPEAFGFSKAAMRENHIPVIVCGHVGAFNGLIWHTEMAHIFRQTEDGLFMASRFWMGKTLKDPLLRRVILTEELARGMAEHCCVEYRNLLELLPVLYNEERRNSN